MELIIKLPTIQVVSETQTKVSVPYIVENESKELWYLIESKYTSYLTADVADAYVVGFLLYAMERNLNIKSEIPLSERLYFQLTKYLMPFLVSFNKHLHVINISANLVSKDYEAIHVGTGISCGVDSLSTIVYHGLEEKVEKNKIDTLTLLNTGYYGCAENNSENYRRYIQQSFDFAEKHHYNFLTVDSNLSNVMEYNFLSAHTYLTCSVLLLLQKYFSVYYYASGYTVNHFRVDFSDSANYDIFLLDCISTENLKFYSSCCVINRIGKIRMIAQYKDIFESLYVCTRGIVFNNCSHCEKCVRTTLALDSMKMIEELKQRFNYSIFKKYRNRYLNYMLRHKGNNPYYKEAFDCYKKNKIKIPFLAYFSIMPCTFERREMLRSFMNSTLGRWIRKKSFYRKFVSRIERIFKNYSRRN